jgi:hypothetical protein
MTTSIESLPLLQANIGVGSDEDLVITLGFTMADGVTPLSLAGISFTTAVTSLLTGTTIAILSSEGGEIVVSGGSSNLLTITELAAAKAAWAVGAYALSLTASDGTFTKDVFVSSSVIVGAPSPLSVTVVRALGVVAVSAASPAVPVAPAAVQAAVVAYFAGLPTTEPGAPGELWTNGGVLQVS